MRCGDGVVQKSYEDCDKGDKNGSGFCDYGDLSTNCKSCSIDCKEVQGIAIFCGDGIVQKNEGEKCDDGTDNGKYDHCAADCKGTGPHCGDGIKNGTEECDDGNGDNGDYCNSNCKIIGKCGDGVVNTNEECDEGGVCENDNSINCTKNEDCSSVFGKCITILKNGCNPNCKHDIIPPIVKKVFPLNSSINVITDEIVVEFSEVVNFKTVKILVTKGASLTPKEILPNETINSKKFTFSFIPDYLDVFEYKVTVPKIVKDLGGNILKNDFVWKFKNDKNECLKDNGNCEQKCINESGTYHCSCNSGYQLESDGKTCEDINECNGTNDCEQKCINDDGSYHCSCKSGYQLKSDGKTCEEINECETKNGICEK